VDANGNTIDYTVEVTVVDTLSTTEFKASMVSLYPNPASTQVTIEAEGFTISEVMIFDLTGKLIKTSREQIIQISELSAGLYMLRLKDDLGNILTKKLIKK
ncbi:T9SS type A sorting domain-containing protein, partial [Psychroflexus salis]|uniref:T9SS type A sorting domain-containing protein n=1 Tax=Psychroflexus salis TaxID=1526574 RepID=UPI001666A357